MDFIFKAYPQQKQINVPSVNEMIRQTVYEKYGEYYDCGLHRVTDGYKDLEHFLTIADTTKKLYLLTDLGCTCFIAIVNENKLPTNAKVNSIEDIVNIKEGEIKVQQLTDIGCLFVSGYDIAKILPFVSAAQNLVTNRVMKYAGSTAYKIKRL
jgi:hypothetical protein